jgi:hypothetical protein
MFGKIGRITPVSSGTNPLRADQLGGLIISGGDYQDSMLGGEHYFALCLSQNVALYTATAGIGLIVYNPPTSGVNMVPFLWGCQVWATSATMTGLMLAVNSQPTLPATVTAATLTGKCLLTGSTGLAVGKCAAYSIATIIAPVAVWPLFHNTAAINTVGAEVISGDLRGTFGFAPGTCAVLGALGAAGVTVSLGLTWKEVPVGL